jgi:subtilisin family serine protease
VFTTEERLEKVLSAAPGQFEFVEPDGYFSLDPEEEVELQTAPWGLDMVGVDSADYTGKGSHIYVLDTGVRTTHTDFGGRAVPAVDCTDDVLEECASGDLICAADKQGHGTHCAGTAAGSTMGVAPDALVYSIKVLSDGGGGSWSWSYWALDWLATKGQKPSISSMSLGGKGIVNGMKAAVDAAVIAGVAVVVAAGNNDADSCGFSPAFVASAITVGSTTSANQRSSFSNYGSCTNIWAPGSAILSASHTSDSGTTSLSGTSMACPHVSGAVAMLFEELGAGKAAGEMVRELQTRSAKNRISGLFGGLYGPDNNFLLWVGAGDAPPPSGSHCRRRLLCVG